MGGEQCFASVFGEGNGKTLSVRAGASNHQETLLWRLVMKLHGLASLLGLVLWTRASELCSLTGRHISSVTIGIATTQCTNHCHLECCEILCTFLHMSDRSPGGTGESVIK